MGDAAVGGAGVPETGVDLGGPDLRPPEDAPPLDLPRDLRVVDAVGPGARGLVLHWRLDETSGTVAQDSSASGLHGTYRGTPPVPYSYEAASTGFVNQGSRQFSAGANHDIRLEGGPAPLRPTVGLTVSVWFRTSATNRGDLVSYGGDYFIRHANGVLEFVRRRPPGSSSALVTASGTAAGSTDGTWHHAVGVADAVGTRIWMDGKRVDIDVSSLPFTYTAGSPFVVGRSASGSQPFEGWLDDVRVYDRALSDDEIRALALGAN